MYESPVPSASKFPLGRLIPSLCAGLQLRSAEEVRYTGNHLTTRPYFAGVGPPPNQFRPNCAAPGGYEAAGFVPVTSTYAYVFSPLLDNPTLPTDGLRPGNYLSQYAWNFDETTLLTT